VALTFSVKAGQYHDKEWKSRLKEVPTDVGDPSNSYSKRDGKEANMLLYYITILKSALYGKGIQYTISKSHSYR
jgi:hypothetical protein